MRRVEFKNRIGLTIVGNMFFPEDFDDTKHYPAIVFGHPAASTKELTSGKYAEALSKAGYVTMAYDATCQGESEGRPRHLEDPSSRVEDIRAAIDYFTTLPFVDHSRMAAAGVCAGAAYAIKAAQTDKRIRAVAGVSPSDIGQIFRRGWTGDQPIEEVYKLLDQLAAERTAEACGAPLRYTGWMPTEGQQPEYNEDNAPVDAFPFISFDRILEFTAFDHVDTLLTQPVLYVIGEEAFTRWVGEDAYNRSMEPKELHLVKGAGHVDLYLTEPYFSEVAARMTTFFDKYLKA